MADMGRDGVAAFHSQPSGSVVITKVHRTAAGIKENSTCDVRSGLIINTATYIRGRPQAAIAAVEKTGDILFVSPCSNWRTGDASVTNPCAATYSHHVA